MLHDITERQTIEMTLRKQTRDVERRTAKLDTFAHTVAHGLQNSLGILLGFVNVLEFTLVDKIDEAAKETFKYISVSAERMNRIISGILMLTSVARRKNAPIGAVDMNLAIDKALNRVETLQAEYHAVITRTDSWPWVMGFLPWIEELWANYVTNAMKYSENPEKGIVPHITLGWQPDTVPEMLRFYVHDNSPGLT